MTILYWILLGLVAGAIAKFIMPGREAGGVGATIVLGILGSFLGGFAGTLLGFGSVSDFDARSLLLATGGAVLLLFFYRILRGGRS